MSRSRVLVKSRISLQRYFQWTNGRNPDVFYFCLKICNNGTDRFVIVSRDKAKVNARDFTDDGGHTRRKTKICDPVRKLSLSDVESGGGYSA